MVLPFFLAIFPNTKCYTLCEIKFPSFSYIIFKILIYSTYSFVANHCSLLGVIPCEQREKRFNDSRFDGSVSQILQMMCFFPKSAQYHYSYSFILLHFHYYPIII